MKKICCKVMKFVYFFMGFWVVMTMHAHAYIDPSAVTYVIQAVAAVCIALGAVVTVFRHKIVKFFKKNKKNSAKKEIHLTEETKEKDNNTTEK